MSRLFLLLLLLAVMCFSCGCIARIGLKSPDEQAKADLPKGGAPTFSWGIWEFYDRARFNLEIAEDPNFNDIIFTKEDIEGWEYKPTLEECFLPGDRTYYWRVNGYYVNFDGSRGNPIECEKIRSFTIRKRPTVTILIKVPAENDEGKLVVNLGDEDARNADFEATLEAGEWKKIAYVLATPSGETRRIAGKIQVVNTNETTRYGNIIVDNVLQKTVNDILSGSVGDFRYELGGETIVEMKLGSRSE